MVLGPLGSLFAFFLGLIIGSFLNVCIYRLPLGKSIIHPPSSCPKCGERVQIYDNVPLVSYILLLGKCRYCRTSIPIHYPLVELITGLLSLALFVQYGLSPQFGTLFAFCASLIAISFIDLHHKIIPDTISLPGILVGFAFSSLGWTETTWADSLIGLIAGGGFLYLVAIVFEKLTGKEGMGGGDVKLLAMIGAWMGWRTLPFIVLISSLAGILIGGVSLIFSGRGLQTKIPFGPFLALGALVYLFFGNDLVRWYIGLFS